MKLLIKAPNIEIAKLYTEASHNPNGDAGLDLYFVKDVTVPAKAIGYMISLGIQCEPVQQYVGVPVAAYELFPRSSIGKTPIRLANSIGLIDTGYRGEIKVMVDNLSDQSFQIEKGTRLFQLVAADRKPIQIMITDKLSDSIRGHGGHGSTGK